MEAIVKRQQGMARVARTLPWSSNARNAAAWRAGGCDDGDPERIAEEEEREKDRLLELALDRLKKEQEINLLAMRVQCLWRRRKASAPRGPDASLGGRRTRGRLAPSSSTRPASARCRSAVWDGALFARNHGRRRSAGPCSDVARQAAEVENGHLFVSASICANVLDKRGPAPFGGPEVARKGRSRRVKHRQRPGGVRPEEGGPWQASAGSCSRARAC